MREPSPIVIERMLALRQLPGFGDTELGELAVLAENAVERTYAAGSVVASPGSRAAAIHLILDGALQAPGRTWGPRSLLGALEAISGRALAERVVATTTTRTLELTTAAFAEILEDNYGVLSTTRRLLARRLLAFDNALVTAPRASVELGSLGMVERLLILRARLPFGTSSLQALSTLAQATEELRFRAGSAIHRRSEEAAGPLMVLDGFVRMRRGDGRELVTSRSTIAGLETIAEVAYLADADALTDVHALRLPTGALFDVMEDHSDFAIALLARMAGDLLDRQHQEVN